jgi:hypothetical protein
MLAGEHRVRALSSKVWKLEISSRERDVGSGLRSAAAKEAFAMAT